MRNGKLARWGVDGSNTGPDPRLTLVGDVDEDTAAGCIGPAHEAGLAGAQR